MTQTPETDKRTPKLLPPHYLMLSILTILALAFAENGEFIQRWWPLAFAACGVWLAVREKNRFVRRGTTFYPGKEASKLVTDGAYRFSRNPMYLGMVIVLVSLWGASGAWFPVVPIVLFIAIIQHRFILREEAQLEGIFGDDYRQYKRSVRRWI